MHKGIDATTQIDSSDLTISSDGVEVCSIEKKVRRLDEILARRQRLLTELFFLFKYQDLPQEYCDSATISVLDSADLKVFLAENDLKSGSRFSVNTLPDLSNVVVNSYEREQYDAQVSQAKLLAENEKTIIRILEVPDSQETRAETVHSGTEQKPTLLLADADLPLQSRAPPGSLPIEPDDMMTKPANGLSTNNKELVTYITKVESLDPPLPESTVELSTWLVEASANPLCELMDGAHKVVTTQAWMDALLEKKWIKTLEKIEHLKADHRWSLRQPIKQKSIPRQKTHWDFFLDEMSWLQVDFKEERKWKIAMARKVARWVLDWHNTADKSQVCVKARSVVTLGPGYDVQVASSNIRTVHPSAEDDAMVIDIPLPGTSKPEALRATPTPLPHSSEQAEVFGYSEDELMASIAVTDDSYKTHGFVLDLPLYAPPTPSADKYNDPLDQLPIIPMSIYNTRAIRVKPARKRTKPDDSDEDTSVLVRPPHPDSSLPASNSQSRRKSSGVFNIRPPMPPTNLDSRMSPAWTSELDELLLGLLAEYQYNWDLVSQAITPVHLVVASGDCRTPWDCFERWVHIDAHAAHVTFTGPHARVVQARVENMAKSPKSSGHPLSATKRQYGGNQKKPQQGEVHRQRQHSLFDAMRKIQRKRENSTKPSSAPKRAGANGDSGSTKTPPAVPTPAHLSQMKYERDQQIARAIIEQRNQQQALALQQQQQGRGMSKGGPNGATPAQIAQIQAARQTQQKAQLAQQHAAASGDVHSPTIQRAMSGVLGANQQRPPMTLPPSRPGSASSQIVAPVPNPAGLRIPPGTRLSQEQMQALIMQRQQQLLQQARANQANGVVISPSSHPLPTQQSQLAALTTQQQQQQQLQQLHQQLQQPNGLPATTRVSSASATPER